MKLQGLTVCACLLLSVTGLSACPGSGGENADKGAAAGGSDGNNALPVGDTLETNGKVPETVPGDDALANEPGARFLRLELDGLRLGKSYDECSSRVHADGSPQVSGIWEDQKGGTGVMLVRPADGSPMPADEYFFSDGSCVGYFKRFELSFDDYLVLVRQLAVTFDPASEAPPEWALDDPLIKGLPSLEGASQRLFWDDPGRKEVLIIQRIHPSGHCFCALYRPAACAELGVSYEDLAEVFSLQAAK
jgi:hypothetical protein